MERMLIIGYKQDYTIDIIPDSMKDVVFSYKEYSTTILKVIRRLCVSFRVPYQRIWYACKDEDFSKYDIILLYECMGAPELIAYIRERNLHCRIIYWQWNTVAKKEKVMLYSPYKEFLSLLPLRERYSFEIWSFDRGDCERYGLFYNNQVAIRFPIEKVSPEYDLFFCGQDKKRFPLLNGIVALAEACHLSHRIFLRPDAGVHYPQAEGLTLLKRNLPYVEMVHRLQRASILVDLVQNGQGGLTWRPLEAMFYQKKLITNYRDIVTYDFYSENNIFIIGKDRSEDFAAFVARPYQPVSESIVQKYEYTGWVKNFIR
ncbi:hypothetical protein [Selenomonas sp. CM52]|uniref:hypothetical protein n=1 Tax=Selenomonas sp. CM52 TaxID=936381 RepID=UPI00027C3960|nr:hypothetical protein [Selenomonas sp. CM52]EJU29817.1 hypothetical protein HMPREF1153_1777 [Selenomonas sp. CM52]